MLPHMPHWPPPEHQTPSNVVADGAAEQLAGRSTPSPADSVTAGADDQAPGRQLRDSDGNALQDGEYLMSRPGELPQRVTLFEDQATGDMWLRVIYHGHTRPDAQRVDELATDVLLVRLSGGH